MPKKTRRGGKYTTGIKRTSTGGYGGQTTGRRGCLSMVLAVVAIVAVVLLAGCDPEQRPVPKQGRGVRIPVVEQVNAGNVRSLCNYVETFTDTPEARGNVGIKAEMSGVPDSLEAKAKAYGRAPTEDGKRLVLLECAVAGWVR